VLRNAEDVATTVTFPFFASSVLATRTERKYYKRNLSKRTRHPHRSLERSKSFFSFSDSVSVRVETHEQSIKKTQIRSGIRNQDFLGFLEKSVSFRLFTSRSRTPNRLRLCVFARVPSRRARRVTSPHASLRTQRARRTSALRTRCASASRLHRPRKSPFIASASAYPAHPPSSLPA
jgi:hypothetical protein